VYSLAGEFYILRILVVDDHELTRLTLQLTFARQDNVQVVGMARNGQEAIEMVKSHYPDVIILDLQMPIMDGWMASKHIKSIFPQTQIIAYSSVEDIHIAEIRATPNIDVFCHKDTPMIELVALVKQLGDKSCRKFAQT
jgi:DNA-binding NarL/FixJ family response regulator